jgi:hypothetical protein
MDEALRNAEEATLIKLRDAIQRGERDQALVMVEVLIKLLRLIHRSEEVIESSPCGAGNHSSRARNAVDSELGPTVRRSHYRN